MDVIQTKSRAILFCALVGASVGASRTASADVTFIDAFSTAAVYSSQGDTTAYVVSDEDAAARGLWTSGGGSLIYSRNAGTDPNYNYKSSVILTSGTTAVTGSTRGLAQFTVSGSIINVPAVNTAQPGLVISASVGAGPGTGGYLLASYNGLNRGPGSPFALLAISGDALLGDEGSATVIQNFGIPVTGHDYGITVSVDRTGVHPSFSVNIEDFTSGSTFYSGQFADPFDAANFGGTQIGYRVRDPLDAEMPSFGVLSLSVPVPEPMVAGLLGISALAMSVGRPIRRRRL